MQTTTKIEKIIRRYFLDLYASKFGNLDIMDNFLGKYKIPKLTPLDCLKRLIFKSTKCTRPRRFHRGFTKSSNAK